MVGTEELTRYVGYFTGQKPYMGKNLGISEANQNTVLNRFFKDVEGAAQTEPRTKAAYLYAIITILEYKNKDFHDFTKDDMNEAINQIYASNRFGARRIKDLKAAILTFWSWLYKDDENAKRGRHGYPVAVDWFRDNGKHEKKQIQEARKKKRILSLTEIKTLIDSVPNLNEKTMLAVAYATASRPDEFENLKIRDKKITAEGIEIHLHGHKGERTVGIYGCAGADSFLHQYLNKYHPEPDNPNMPLWGRFTERGWVPFEKRMMEHLLKKAQRKAKLDGKINPYSLRHSRLTELAGKITEQELKVFAGHTPSSPMLDIYIHLNQTQVKNKLMVVEGGQKIELIEEKNPLIPIVCPNCQTKNPAVNEYCYQCKQPLAKTSLKELGDYQKHEAQHREILEHRIDLLERRLQEPIGKKAGA